MKNVEPPSYTVPEIADLLGVESETVRLWINSGDLLAARIGRQLWVTAADLQSFVDSRINRADEGAGPTGAPGSQGELKDQ